MHPFFFVTGINRKSMEPKCKLSQHTGNFIHIEGSLVDYVYILTILLVFPVAIG